MYVCSIFEMYAISGKLPQYKELSAKTIEHTYMSATSGGLCFHTCPQVHWPDDICFGCGSNCCLLCKKNYGYVYVYVSS